MVCLPFQYTRSNRKVRDQDHLCPSTVAAFNRAAGIFDFALSSDADEILPQIDGGTDMARSDQHIIAESNAAALIDFDDCVFLAPAHQAAVRQN